MFLRFHIYYIIALNIIIGRVKDTFIIKIQADNFSFPVYFPDEFYIVFFCIWRHIAGLRYGFKQVGLRKAYYPAALGRREDALVMSFDLTAGKARR